MRAFFFGLASAIVLMAAAGLVYNFSGISVVEQSATNAVHVTEG
jgi:hypothetical protein